MMTIQLTWVKNNYKNLHRIKVQGNVCSLLGFGAREDVAPFFMFFEKRVGRKKILIFDKFGYIFLQALKKVDLCQKVNGILL